MNRTDRLYALAEDLRTAGSSGRTAAALARRFEVSARTVKRDVSALQQAGVPERLCNHELQKVRDDGDHCWSSREARRAEGTSKPPPVRQ